jgi:hypothetical protein
LAVHQPTKSAAFKLTVATNMRACSMVELFSDVVHAAHELGNACHRAQRVAAVSNVLTHTGERAVFADINTSEFAGTHAIGFRFWPLLSEQPESGAMTATIQVSKNGGRYRVQANSLAALYFVVDELQSRLKAYFQTAEGVDDHEEVEISFDDPLPLGDLHSLMDDHHTLRQQLIEQQLKVRRGSCTRDCVLVIVRRKTMYLTSGYLCNVCS